MRRGEASFNKDLKKSCGMRLVLVLLLFAGAYVPTKASFGVYQPGAHTLFYLPLNGPTAGAPDACKIWNAALLPVVFRRWSSTLGF